MSVEWGTLSERASWPASMESPLQTLWSSLGRPQQPGDQSAAQSAAEIAQLAALSNSAAEQLEPSSPALLVPSSAVGDIVTPGPAPLQAVLASPQRRHTNKLPEDRASYKAASHESVHSSKSAAAWESVAAADPDGLAIIGTSSADSEIARLQLKWSQAADAGSSSSSSNDSAAEGILSRSEPAATEAAEQEQAGQQSILRVSKATRPGLTLPEGNILGFDHGACERRPGGLQSLTASGRISQWLEKGHEVISVRL